MKKNTTETLLIVVLLVILGLAYLFGVIKGAVALLKAKYRRGHMKNTILLAVLLMLCGCAYIGIICPPTYTFKAVFDHQEDRSNYKGCCLLNTKYGIFSSVYDFKSRRNSELWLNWSLKYKNGQETIGQGREYNGKVYFATEYGKGLVYDGNSVREVCPLRHASTVVIYKGQPCFVSSEDAGEYLINGDNGSKVMKLAVPPKVGIPFSSAQVPNSEEWIIVLADNGGGERLVTTDGKVIPLSNAVTIENWNGTIIAGAGGKLYKVDVNKGTTTEYFNTGSQVVNHLWYDTENKLLWVSCSGTDKLLYFDAKGKMTKVIELTDDTGSALFDSRITKDWWYRALGTKAQWYRIEKTKE